MGVDFIPNEVTKSPGIYYIVYKLFAAVFDKGMVPSTWLRAIVNPIPKGSGKASLCPFKLSR